MCSPPLPLLQSLEGGDGDGDTPAAKSLHDLAANSNRGGEELDDERQLRMLQKELQGDKGDAARWGTGDVRACFVFFSCISTRKFARKIQKYI